LFDNLTKEEEKELFKRLNAGMKLSTKSRALASCKDLDNLLDIGEHELFKEMLSDKAKEAKNQVALVMKAWCMLNQDINKVSFESKNFNPLLEEIEVSEDEKQELNNVFDMIKEVHDTLKERKEKKIAKKIYTELHMISLVPYFKQAIESNTDTETIADWITDFFGVENSLSKSDNYNMACKGGTAKNDSIKTRHNELKLSYEDFFKEKE
jgi:regulator of sigma D